MNQGVLQFTLGLAAGGFTTALGQADARLRGFIGGMVGLGAVTAGVMQAIDKGAELEHLHRRTGESVQDLFLLQKGFKAAGLASEDVAPALFQMQRSLGGVNETGESTADIFTRMGLSLSSLKGMGGAQALQMIVRQLGQLNQSEAAKAASTIFGRMQAGNMVQLARSSAELAEGMRGAAGQAAVFARNAALFERIELAIDRIKGKGQALFAGIAEGLAPALENALGMLKSIDLTQAGVEVGRFITALTQAFREGTLADLIAETLRVGFEEGVMLLPPVLEKIGVMLLRVIQTPLQFLQAGMQWVIENAMELAGKLPGVGSAAGLKGFKAGTWSETWQAERAGGLKVDVGTGAFGLDDITRDADDRMRKAREALKGIAAPLLSMIDGLVSRAPKVKAAEAATAGRESAAGLFGEYKQNSSALEKMGFVFRGGAGIDHNATTARNTTAMVGILRRIDAKLKPGGNFEFANL